jgi:hypothetical protein
MAANIAQSDFLNLKPDSSLLKKRQYNTSDFLDLNVQYDFVPANQNFLVLSRLNFALKKNKIHNLIIKKKRE